MTAVASCVGREDTGANPTAGTRITVTPAELPADGASRAVVDVYLLGGDGTPLVGVPVVLSASGNVQIEQPQLPTDAHGHTAAALLTTIPGSVSLQVHATLERTRVLTPATAQVRFTPSGASAGNRLSLSVTPATASVDVATRRSVLVRLLSAEGAPVPQASVSVASSRAIDILSPSQGLTASDGTFTTTLLSTKAGLAQLTASAAGAPSAQGAASFLSGAPDAAHTYFLTQLGNEVAADGLGSAAEVFVGDQYGNPVSYAPVSVVAPAQNVVLVPPSGVADGQGIFHTSVTATDLGSAAIVVDTGATSSQHNVQLIVGPPSAATSSLFVTPSTLVANGVSSGSLFAVFTDAAGHPRVGDAVLFSSSDPNDVFTPASSVTDATGLAQSTVRSTHAAAATLLAQGQNLTLSSPVSFAPGPPTTSASTLSVSPNPWVASASSNTTLSAQLRDAQGNPAPGVVLHWSSSDSSVVFAASASTTDATGQGGVQLQATRSGNVRLSAAFGGSTLATTLVVQPAALSLAHSSFVVSPTTLTADGQSQATLSVTARDVFDNPLAQQPVAVTGAGPNGVLSPASGLTTTQGLFVSQLTSTQAGTLNLTASLGAQTLGAPVTFVAGAPAASTSSLSVSPASTTADGQATLSVTAHIADAQGNPRTNQSVSFSSSAGGDVFHPASAVTDAQGNVQTLVSTTLAGARNLSARAGALTLSVPASFVPGAAVAAHSTLSVTPQSITADGTSLVTLTAILSDAYGNAVPGAQVAFSSSQDGPNTRWQVAGVAQQNGTTDSSGTVVAQLAVTSAGTVQVTASVGGFALSGSFTATPGAPNATLSALTLAPTTLVAGTTGSVALRVADALNNPVPNVHVTLTASDASAQFVPATLLTNAMGTASASIRPTVRGTDTVLATLTSAGNLTLSQSVTVLAAAPAASTSTLSVAPNVVVADGSASALLALSLRDAYGNPASNVALTFSSSTAQDAFAGATTTTSDANGQASVTVRSPLAGPRTLAATAGNITLSAAMSFVAGPLSQATSSLSLAPNSVVADGAQAVTATFVARDAQGNPIASLGVASTVSGGTLQLSPAAGQTDATGAFVTTATTTVAGLASLSLSAGNTTFVAAVHAVPGSAAASSSTLTLAPHALVADGQSQTLATVLLRDRFGNALPNVAVQWTGPGVTQSQPSGSTDASGLANVLLSATQAGNQLIIAQAAGLTLSAPVTFLAGAPNAQMSQLLLSSTSAPANNVAAITLTALLRDAFGNVSSQQNVTFAASDPNDALTPSSALSDSLGRAQSSVRSGDAGAQTLTVSFAGKQGTEQLGANVLFVPLDANNTLLSLAVTPNVLVADGIATAQLVATLSDGLGSPIANKPIALDGNGATDTLQPSSGITDANGQVTAVFSSTLARQLFLRATSANIVSQTELSVVAGAASAQTSSFVAMPNALVADGQSQTSFALLLKDAFGNALKGAPVGLTAALGNLTLSANQGLTDQLGQLQISAVSTLAGLGRLVATSGNFALGANVQFSPGPLDVGHSSVVAGPNAAVADGQSAVTLAVVARDAFNNARGAAAFTARAAAGNSIVLTPASGVADASGTALLWLTSTLAQSQNVIVTLAGVPFVVPVQFVAGAPNATRSTLTALGGPVVADGVAQASLVASILDAFANPVGAANLLVASNDAHVTLSPNAAQSAADGSLSFFASSTFAATPTVSVSVQGSNVTLTAPVQFVAGPASLAHSTLSVRGSPTVADTQAAVTLTSLARDAQNNPVTHVAASASTVQGQLTLADGAAGQSAAQLLVGQTDGLGQWTVLATSAVAEDKAVAITVGPISLGANLRFVPGPPDANASLLVITPSATVADGGSQASLVVTVRDAYRNLIANQSVVFAADGSQDLLQPTSTTTNGAGIAIAALSSTVAEQKNISAQLGNVTLRASEPFVAGVASSATSSVAVQPNSIVADGNAAAVLRITVRDAAGNLALGRAVQLSAASLQLSPAAGVTDANGVFVAIATSTVAGNALVQAAVDQINLSAPLVVSPGPPDPAHSSLSVTPSSVTADGNAQGAISLRVADAQGNPIGNAPLTLSVQGNNNILGQVSGVTSATGRWLTSLASTVAETKQLTVTVLGVQLFASSLFVPGAPDAAHSSLTLTPNSVTADGLSQAALLVTLSDAQGNPIPNSNVTLSAPGAQLSAAAGVTDAHARFAAQLTSTLAGPVTVTLTAPPTSLSASFTFTPGLPSASSSTLSVTPSQVTADNTQSIVATLVARDAYGNRIPNQAVSWAASGLRNTLGAASTTTGPDGMTQTTLQSARAQTEQLSATFGGVTLQSAVTFVPGQSAASFSALSVSPNTVVADGQSPVTVTLSVQDAQGNPEPNQIASLSVGGSNNTLGTIQLVTGSNGTASTTLVSTRAELKALSAQLANFSLASQALFVAGAPASATSTLGATPLVATADGTATITVSVAARDAFGNPTPNQAIGVSVDGQNNALGSSSLSTDTTGSATTTLRSTAAQTKTVSITLAGITKSVQVSFLAGPMSSATSTLTLSPNHVLADGNSLALLQLTALDAQGNPLVGQGVTFASSGAASDTLSSASTLTDASGAASSSIRSTLAGLRTLTATVGQSSLTGQLQFFPGAPSTQTSLLQVTPAQLTADGTSYASVVVVAEDAFGNLIANQNIALSVSGAGASFANAQGATDGSGGFATQLVSTLAEAKIVTASLGQTTLSGNVLFTPGSPSSVTSSLSAVPSQATADGISAITLTVLLRDAQNNPVPGRAFSLSSTGLSNTFTPQGGVTDGAGRGTVQLTSTRAESKTLIAALNGLSLSTSANFVPGVPSLGSTTLSITPNATTPDNATQPTLLLAVLDAQGNPVPGQAATLASSNMGDVIQPNSVVSDGNGLASALLIAAQAGSHAVTATLSNFSVSSSLLVLPGAPNQALSSLLASPNQVTADGVSQATLTVLLSDRAGNPVPNQNLSIQVSGGALTNYPLVPVTNQAGTATFTSQTTVAGARTITLATGNVVLTTGVGFVSGPVSNAQSSVTLTPNSAVADGNATLVVGVMLADAYRNVIANQPVSFSAGGLSNTFAPPSGVTDSNGRLMALWSSTQAAPKTVVANVGTTTLSAQGVFVAGAPAAATSQLVVSPNVVVADGQSQAAVALYLADAFNNPVQGQNVQWGAFGNNLTFLTGSGVTNASGQAAATVASTLAQQLNIVAAAGNLTLVAPLQFTAGSPNAAQSSLLVSPNVSIAGGNVVATLSLHDAFGNPTPNQSVTLSGGTNVVVLTPVTPTDATGTLSLSLTTQVAQLAALQAAVGPLRLTASWQVAAGPISASTSSLLLTPNSTTAGMNVTARAQLADVFGNPVAGATPVLQPVGGLAVVSAFGPSAGTGASTAVLQPTVAAPTQLTLSVGNISLTANLTVVSGPPSAATSQLTLQGNSVVANNSNTFVVGGTIKDAFGNPVVNGNVSLVASVPRYLSQHYMALTATARNANLYVNGVNQPNYILFNSGQNGWRYSNYYLAQLQSGNNLLRFVDSDAQTYIDYLTVTSRQRVTIVEAESGVVGGGAAVRTTVPGYSGSGYVYLPAIANANVTVSLALGVYNSTSATIALRFSMGNYIGVNEIVNGTNIAFFHYSPSLTPNTWELTPILPTSLFTIGLNNFALMGPSPSGANIDQIIVTQEGPGVKYEAELGQLTGNAVISTAVSGYTGTGYVAGLTDPNSSLTLTVPITSESFASSVVATDLNGTFVTSWASNVAEGKTLAASIGNLTLYNSASFVAGPPSISTTIFRLSASANITAGSTFAYGVQVLDAFSNPVGNTSVAYSVVGNAVVASPTGTTDSDGTSLTYAVSTLAGSTQLCATVAGLPIQCKNANIIAGAPNAYFSTATLSPNVSTAGAASTLSVLLQDAYGNPVPNQPIVVTGGSNIVLLSALQNTNAAGSSNGTLQTTLAQNCVIQAISGNVTFSLPFAVSAASPNALWSSISLSPNVASATLSSTPISIRGHVADVYGNPASNQIIALAARVPRLINVGYSSTYSPGYDTLLLNGVQQTPYSFYPATPSFSVWGSGTPQLLPLSSGNNTIGIIDSDQPLFVDYFDVSQGDTNQLFEAELGVLGGNAVVASALGGYSGTGYVAMDNSGNSTITINAFADVVSPNTFLAIRYHRATWGVTSGNLIINNNFVTTMAFSGSNPTWPLTYLTPVSLTPGNNTIQLAGGSNLLLIDQFVLTKRGPTRRVEAESGVTTGGLANLSSGTASGGRYIRLDAYLGTITVPYVVSTESVVPSTTVTDANGNFVSAWGSTTAEAKQLVASFGNLVLASAAANFVPATASQANSQLAMQGGSLSFPAGSPFYASAVVYDPLGNPIVGLPVVWTSSQANDLIQPVATVSNSFGTATVGVTALSAGPRLLCAQAGNLFSLCQNAQIVASAPNALLSQISVTPSVITAGGNTLVQVRIRDAYNNPVVSFTPSLSGGQNILTQSAFGPSDANGAASTTIGSTLAQNLTVIVGLSTANLSTPLSIVAGQPSSSMSTLNTPNYIVNVGSNVTVTGTFVDQYNNPIKGAAGALAVQANRLISFDYQGGYAPIVDQVMYLNGALQPNNLVYAFTGPWGSKIFGQSVGKSVVVNSGNNLLSVSSATQTSGIVYDFFTVSSQEVSSRVEAENSSLFGGASVSNSSGGYTGSGYVNLYSAGVAGLQTSSPGSSVSPNTYLAVRFSSGNTGTIATYINGQFLTNVQVGGSAGVLWTYSNLVPLPPSAQNVLIKLVPSVSMSIDNIIFMQRIAAARIEAESGSFTSPCAFDNSFSNISGAGVINGCVNANGVVSVNVPMKSETLSANSFLTDTNGNFSFSWSSQLAESKSVAATLGNTMLARTIAFSAIAPSTNTSLLASSTNVVVAGNNVDIFAVIKDSFGNPVANSTVLLQSNPNIAQVISFPVTDITGSTVARISSTLAQNYIVSATVGNFVLSMPLAVIAGAPNAIASSLSASPNVLSAGNVSILKVTLADAYGNAVPNAAVGLTGTGNYSILAAFTATNSQGFSQASLSATQAQNILLTASSGSANISLPLSVIAGAPNTMTSTFSLVGNAIADNQNGAYLSGHLADAYNNVIANQNIVMGGSLTRSYVVRYSATGHTQVNSYVNGIGQANAFFILTKTQDNWQFSAPQGNPGWANYPQIAQFSPVNNNYTMIVNSAGLNMDSLTVTSGDLVQTFEAENAIVGGGAGVTSSVANYSGSGYVSLPTNANSSVTFSVFQPSGAGNALLSYRYQSVNTGTLAIAVNGNIQTTPLAYVTNYWWNSQQVIVRLQSGNNGLTLWSPDQNFLLDRINLTTPGVAQLIEAETGTFSGTAAIQNTYLGYTGIGYVGPIYPGSSSSLTFNLSSESLPAVLKTDSNGNFSSFYNSTVAENKIVSASVGNFSLSANLKFSQGNPAPNTSLLSLGAASAIAGANIAIAVLMRDSFLNPIPNMMTTLSSTSANYVITPSSAALAGNGVLYANLAPYAAGQQNICAQVAAQLTVCSSILVTAGPASTLRSSLAFSSNTMVAGGNISAVVVVADAYGNPVANVAPTLAGGTNITLLNSFSATDLNGTSTAILTSNVAQNVVFLASIGNLQLQQNLKIVAGLPVVASSFWSASANAAIADGANAIIVNAHFADAFNNPASGQNYSIGSQMSRSVSMRYAGPSDSNVRLTVNGVLQPPSPYFAQGPLNYNTWSINAVQNILLQSGNNYITVTSAATNNFDYLLTSSADYADTLEAESGTIAGAAIVSQSVGGYYGTGFVGFPSAQNSTFALSYFSPRSNPNAYIGVRVYSPVNVYGSLAVTNNGVSAGNISVAYGSTSSWAPSGTVQTAISAGNNLIMVQGSNQPIYIDQLTVYHRGITQLTEAESGVYANGARSQNTVLSYSGAGYAAFMGGAASFTDVVNIGSDQFLPAATVLDANGNASLAWRSTVAELKQMTLTAGNVSWSGNFTFVGGAPYQSTSSFAVAGNSVAAGNMIVVAAAVYDALQNPVAGYTVNLTATGIGNSFSPASPVTDSWGRAFSTYSSQNASPHQLCAQVGNLFSLCQNVVVQPSVPDASMSSLTTSPSVVTAGAPFQFNGVLADKYGNRCASQNAIVVLKNGANTVATIANVITDAAGNLNITVPTSLSGNYLVTFAQTGNAPAANIEIDPNSPYIVALQADNNGYPAGLTGNLIVRIVDVFNNVSPNFTGVVNLSSAAPNATVPSSYSFSPTDAGIHVFSGGLRFLTPFALTANYTIQAVASGNIALPSSSLAISANFPAGPTYNLIQQGSSPTLCLGAINDDVRSGSGVAFSRCRDVLAQIATVMSDDSIRYGNRCLSVMGGNVAVGQNIALQVCLNNNAMRWSYSANSIVLQANPSYCIDPTTNPASLGLCSSGNASVLQMRAASPYFSPLSNEGFTFDAVGENFYNGSWVQMYPINGQKALLLSPQDTLQVVVVNFCIDVASQSVSVGSQIQFNACGSSNSQKWAIVGPTIRPLGNQNLCISRSGALNDGNLQLCNGAPAQNFLFPTRGFSFELVSQQGNADLCLQVGQVLGSANALIGLAPCVQNANQLIVFGQGRSSVNGVYYGGLDFPYLASQFGGTMPQLDAGSGSPPVGTWVTTKPQNTYSTTQSIVMPALSQGLALSFNDTTNLCIDVGSANSQGNTLLQSCNGNSSQLFGMRPLLARFSPSTQPNLCLSASGINGSMMQPLTYQTCSASPLQRFIMPFNSSPTATGPSPVISQGLCLDTNSTGALSPNQAFLQPCGSSSSQQTWQPPPNSGWFINGANNCIDATGVSVGSTVYLATCNGTGPQTFKASF